MSKTRKCIECQEKVTTWHKYGEVAVMCVRCARKVIEECWDDE